MRNVSRIHLARPVRPIRWSTPALPASKSHAQRALLVAMFVGGRLCGLKDPASDLLVLIEAAKALGASCLLRGTELDVIRKAQLPPSGTVSVGENGTALRMLAAMTAVLGGRVVFERAEGLRRRSLVSLVGLLAEGGVSIGAGAEPLVVDGTGGRFGSEFRVDATHTSQPASGALLGLGIRRGVGARPPDRLVVTGRGAVGYVDLSASILRRFGVDVQVKSVGDHLELTVEGAPSPATVDIPPDPSAALFPAVFASIHGLDASSPPEGVEGHPELLGFDDLERCAAGGPLSLDLHDHPDAFPALCVAAAVRSGTTALRGAPALRDKESDRVAAMAAVLRAAGVGVTEHADGLTVTSPLPKDSGSKGTLVLPATADHRIVMAAALLATLCKSGAEVLHPDAVAKSWPSFFDWLGGVVQVTRI